MATDTTYNGYTNYETWNVSLWLDNDQGEQEYWLERATECLSLPGNQYSSPDQVQRYELAQSLKRYHEEGMPEVAGTYADLLSAALSAVNWYEIADNLLEQARENMPEEEEDDEDS
jgi:hypothetical protein